jgi:hypothetical protein
MLFRTARYKTVGGLAEANPVQCAAYSMGAPEPQVRRLILKMTQGKSA